MQIEVLTARKARVFLICMVQINAIHRNAQRSLFPCQGTSVNDAQNANTIGKLSTYLKTRGGLFRLLALFPGSMSVEEALRLAPTVLTKQGKEVAV